MENWGKISGRDEDKLQLAKVGYKTGVKTNTPILDIAYVVHECELVEHHRLGDHTLFVGMVRATHYREEFFDEKTMLKIDKVKPLLYLGKHVYITVNPETKSAIFEG